MFWAPPNIPGMGKATDFKFCRNIHRVDRNKNHVANSSRGRIVRESRKYSGHPCMAHCAVIFAIAQLSCIRIGLVNIPAKFEVRSFTCS